MSAPSLLLLCAGAVASLAGVWALAGLSESSPLRVTPRVSLSALVGLGVAALLYLRAPRELRSDLALPLLFGAASLIALAVGAAKLEAAIADKLGDRAVRRASGIVAGAVLGMAAVGAVSLDLKASSLLHARFAWAFMFALIAGALIVFAGRVRYAGAGLVALGQRALMLAFVAVALLAGARLTVAAPAPAAAPEAPSPAPALAESAPAPAAIAPLPASEGSAMAPSVAAPVTDSSGAAPVAPPSSAEAAAPSSAPGEIEIGEITTRGMLEADARGGVEHRKDRLQACLADPKNGQHGSLKFKVGVDASGSVAFIKATDGDLKGSPLADCLLRVFYKMGFAAPAHESANFHVTLRVP